MPANPLADDLDHILAHSQGIWDELRGQRLFITGGTGFFGCWLLESFTWANDKLGLNAQAVVLTRHPDTFRRKAPHLACHPAIQLHTGDVCSFEFPGGSFSHVVHAAAEANVKLGTENPLGMFDTIVAGTRRTLEFARQAGAKKLLLTSSGAVYGRQPADLTHIPEDYPGAPDPSDPRSAYGEGKRAAELLGALYVKQFALEVKIARCFAFVGPYLPLDAHFAVGNFIHDGLRGGPIVVQGDGTPYRSYLYAADLAIWLWTILSRGKANYPYNVGSAQAMTIAALAQTVAQAFAPPPAIQIVQSPRPGQRAARYVPVTKRAETELNLRKYLDLPEGIQRTVRWHRRLTQT
jgi:nucleoside-diphosphate-sugar epimerase